MTNEWDTRAICICAARSPLTLMVGEGGVGVIYYFFHIHLLYFIRLN